MSFENGDKHYRLEGYPITYNFIGMGFNAIENTVQKMIQVIRESAKNIRIRDQATDIIKGVREKDQYAEADEIYNWVKDNSRYTRDIQGEETLQSPLVALDMIDKGYVFLSDCDCQTTLVLSLLKSVGYPVKIRIAGYKNDDKYTHVYGVVKLYDQWIPIDPIARDQMLGWEHNYVRIKDYDI